MQPAIDIGRCIVVDRLVVQIHVRVETIELAEIHAHPPGQHARNQRPGDGGEIIEIAILADAGLHRGLQRVRGRRRRHHDRAGLRIAPIDRALRAFEDFDGGEIRIFTVECGGVRINDAVNHQRERGINVARAVDATDIHLRIAQLRGAGHNAHARR